MYSVVVFADMTILAGFLSCSLDQCWRYAESE